MTTLTNVLNAALLHSLWQDALIAIVLFVALGALRRQAPTARYAASCVALALMAILPILTAAAPYLGTTTGESTIVSGAVDRLLVANSNAATAIYSAYSRSGAASQAAWLSYVQEWALPCWFAGVLFFSLRLTSSALRTVTLKRRASRADEGIRALVDRLCERLGVTCRVDVLTGVDGEGPAAFGWIRPVILLPPATLMGLTSEQLEAVLAHELAHIRRHDYFVNVFQLVVETLFFYHPAIWWASRRIHVERELCCDDIAVQLCGNALGYAHALTTLAQMMSRTPRMAVGATDAPFVHRIKRLLGVAAQEQRSPIVAVLAVALVVAGGMLNVDSMRLAAQRPASSEPLVFEAAVIKPHPGPGGNSGGCRGIDSRLGSAALSFRPRINAPSASVPLGRCLITNARLDMLISIAFGVPGQRIAGVPSRVRNERFDVEAKAEHPATTTEQQLLSMLQQFLTEQFRLIVRRDTKDGPIYSLVVAKNGPKNLHPSKEERESMVPEGTRLVFRDYSMQGLAEFFSMLPTVQRPVSNMTALEGRFDFSLDVLASPTADVIEAKFAMQNWDTIFSDVQQQLGLRLEPSKGPIETLVIDHAEQPQLPK